jgi:hypothetical protein
LFDYQVFAIPFPSGKVSEAITKNEDGSYTIFVNEIHCPEMQRESLLHALMHILREDFDLHDADLIERIAHE